MTQAELDARMPATVEGYAEENATSRGVPLEKARADAAEQTRRMLPDGIASPGQLLMRAVDDGGAEVGWVWLALPGSGSGASEQRAWINNIEVGPEHRGRGYGRAIMLAAERELAGRGVVEVGLNVFGSNTIARRLYESLGFEVTSQQMAKRITSTAGPASG